MTNGVWGRGYGETFEETTAKLSIPVWSEEKDPYISDYRDIDRKPYIQRLYIGEEELLCQTDGVSSADKKGILEETARYTFPEDTLISSENIRLEIWKDSRQKTPETVFEFAIDETDIIPSEMEIQLSETIELADGRKLQFQKFVYDSQGVRIYAVCKNEKEKKEHYGPVFLNCAFDNGYYDSVNTFVEYRIAENEVVFLPQNIEDLYYVLREAENSVEGICFNVQQYKVEGDHVENIEQEESVYVPLRLD